ncbi:beta-lactamase domain-containing protein [Tepidicaulis marinus]|uniref:Beta-lactamase domain-containing protein n=1 Tax=Tepidicaulis marinus TaxID=1333998 RepID=A0A081B8V5_9HYPH|nr:MBL fold metallo-hydrolase [Tepidicaulis marinus]GAK44473.1 beta-lactamase domain-containing protein [Tepidicaulis marinus]
MSAAGKLFEISRRKLAALLFGFAALAGAGALPAHAQDLPEVETVKLTDTLYMLIGQGGNIGVSAGPDGVYLIDDQFAPMTPAILEAVRAISSGPIRLVVNTHWHGDHTGGNENLGKEGALIFAHENVRSRMEKGQEITAFERPAPPAPKAALPHLTYNDRSAIHLNGEEAQLIHVHGAHTDGDTFIHWPRSNVVHTGDLFFNGFYPVIDAWSGGGIDGVIAALGDVLAKTNEETRFMPGHGALATRTDLIAFREMLKTASASAHGARGKGLSYADWVASKPFAALDAEWGDGFLKAEQFARMVWAGIEKQGE